MEKLPFEDQGSSLRPRTSTPIQARQRRRRIRRATNLGVAKNDNYGGGMLLLDDVDYVVSSECLSEPIPSRHNKRPRTTPSSSLSPTGSTSTVPRLDESGDEQNFPHTSESRDSTIPIFGGASGAILTTMDEPVVSIPTSATMGYGKLHHALVEAEAISADGPGSPRSPDSARIASQKLVLPPKYHPKHEDIFVNPTYCSSCQFSQNQSSNQPLKRGPAVSILDVETVTRGDENGSLSLHEHPSSGKEAWPLERENYAPDEQESCCSHTSDDNGLGTLSSYPEVISVHGHGLIDAKATEKSRITLAPGGDPPPTLPVCIHNFSPGRSRQNFVASMETSDAACQNLRQDLARYMTHVRSKVDEDGSRSVAFPKNFDRVVDLMDRRDLAGHSAENTGRSTENNLIGDEGRRTARGRVAGDEGREAPPWTKYLLEEGLDRTEAFSKYKGVLEDEQTGEYRLLRGLAKMRELDLRLARATQRARELVRKARETAEDTERAPEALDMDRTAGQHARRQGPLAIDNNFHAQESALADGSPRRGDLCAKNSSSDAGEQSTKAPPLPKHGCQEGVAGGTGGRVFLTQKFKGRGPPSSSSIDATANQSISGPTPRGGRLTARSARSSHDEHGSGEIDGSGVGSRRGPSSGHRNNDASFILRNKHNVARSGRRLTEDQECLVSRFLTEDDGFNDQGEPCGEPRGVWAEIAVFGGEGAEADTVRLAEIDAQLRAMRVIEKPDCDDETKSNINNSKSSSAVEDDAGVSGSGTERFTRDDAVSTGNDPRKDDSGAPGEIVLREQREMRQIRDHTRAIDAALEKLRESLFESGGGSEREEAVDQALVQVRSAPISLKAGMRQGAGRVELLLMGKGLQPVGEWEVRHALRQGQEELAGKDLAICSQIQDLLASIRHNSSIVLPNVQERHGAFSGRRSPEDLGAQERMPRERYIDNRDSFTQGSTRRDLEAVARRDGRSTESNASTSMGANSCSDPDVDRMSPANETIRDEFQDDPGSEDPVETSEKESAAKARTLRPPRPPTWNSGKPLRGSVRCSDTPSSVMMPSEVTALFRAPLRGSSIFAPCMSTHAAASVSSSASKA